nr:uncharacterized protein LOC127328879 [Lolium perenne]
MATAAELQKLEAELKERESLLQARQAELDRRLTESGKTPATTTQNPSSYVASLKPNVAITLDLHDSNYIKWRELVLVALGRYGLTHHVIGTDAATPSDTSPTSDWARDDFTVLSWIYGSISPELFGIIMAPGSTARQIWDSIANLFHDNKKSRALALDAEFRNTPQGHISDETLVLTVLRGLNEQYSHLRSFLPYQVPFPSFLHTRSALVLEETQKKADTKTASATALWASGNSVLPPGGGAPPPTPPADRGSASSLTDPRHTALVPYSNPGRGGGYGGRRGRGGGRGRGRDNNNPWMFNPWTGLPTRAGQQQQQSSPPPWQQPPSAPWQPRRRAPGLLGPRPGAAYTAYGHQQPPNGTPQHLDPALLTAL